MKQLLSFALSVALLSLVSCQPETAKSDELQLRMDSEKGTISVFRQGKTEPIVVQNARPDHRPYLHPIAAPDGDGLVTEYSPGHHKHQTGLYWGFTRINGAPDASQDELMKFFYKPDKTIEQQVMAGRDFFHHPGGDYWKRVGFSMIDSLGERVSWETTYHMLGASGSPIMEEKQMWSMVEKNGQLLLDLEWKGTAIEEITVGEFDYGGLFLRMPWKKDINGEVVNFARQVNERAEGQKALWVDAGMQVEGRDDLAHVAIFDHPENSGFPQTWRVDGQLGIGPVRARMGDWTIRKGETETIKHQVVVYTGELDNIALTEQWKTYIGDDNIYATAGLWNVARQEGRDAKFLTAEEAVDEMTVKDGYAVNVFASEPMITQPMAFCWDDKGRMWIAENRDYESRGTGFSGSGDSRILILEDTDHDGQVDSRKVFAEGIPFPSALAVGFGGVFVGAPPNLLFIPDADGDDKADMDNLEILLTGWGIRDRHETINSFQWGPDGWLYGLEGFATPSRIRKPADGGKLYGHNDEFPDVFTGEGVDINGGVWRFHPVTRKFEAVAHGFSNPWGIDYDAKGQLFISACVIPHLFHVIPGGIYHRQGGQHFNPYIYEDIQTIVDHRHRSAHGGARIYQSDAFPEDQRDRLFMANIHEHAVLSDILTPKGSGFVASHGEEFMMANNAQWIGFSMEIGPEGGLYVLDWHDAEICGDAVAHKETGRVFRIMPQSSNAKEWEGRYSDLGLLSDLDLAKLQTSASDWHARRARTILQYRATKGAINTDAIAHLKTIFGESADIDFRLKALWALHLSGAASTEFLQEQLNDDNEYVRGWAIQLLCESENPSKESLARMEELTKTDQSAVVRLYLAAALQRIPEANRWTIGSQLIQRGEDTDDHNIPKMLWFAMEALVGKDIDRGLDLVKSSEIPLVTKFISRRIVEADGIDKLVATAAESKTNQVDMLQGLLAELENRTDLKAPANWAANYQKLKSNSSTSELATEIAQQFGDLEASNQLMTVLKDANRPLDERRSAMKSLASRKFAGLRKALPGLIKNDDLGVEAIRAVAQFDDRDLGWWLFQQYEKLGAAEKLETVMTMASRRKYANILVGAIKDENIPRADIPPYVARQLRRVFGNGFVEIWGPIDDLNRDVEVQYEEYRNLFSEARLAKADMVKGEALFIKTCAPCHKLNGTGGLLGPDITGSNRTDLNYLLTNLVEPDAIIQDEYKMVVVSQRDGRTFLGNVVSETDRQLVLRVVGEEITISKSKIQSVEATPNSMMPSGLLRNISDEEKIDLVGFLMLVGV